MKKKGRIPVTRVKNPEPDINDPDWVIWAAWADRITFEEIEKKTGKTESEVIKIMRRSIKPASFRLWRKRVIQKRIKHRKKFNTSQRGENQIASTVLQAVMPEQHTNGWSYIRQPFQYQLNNLSKKLFASS